MGEPLPAEWQITTLISKAFFYIEYLSYTGKEIFRHHYIIRIVIEVI